MLTARNNIGDDEEPFSKYGYILDTDDLSAEFGASHQTIRRMCADGILPAFKMGRMWYVRKDKLIKFTEGIR